MEVEQIKRTISEYIDNGHIGKEIIDLLIPGGDIVPCETELWDYKKTIGDEKLGVVELVKDIVAFYNAFGGYIIFGIDETEGDKLFKDVGFESELFDSKKIKGLVRSYTDSDIGFVYKDTDSPNGNSIGVLYVPKRQKNVNPICFSKNGPDKKPKRPIFLENETWYRKKDESKKAQNADDFKFLLGSRENQLFDEEIYTPHENVILQHNLPDQNIICANFIGRKKILKELWRWLANEFQYSKLLAGDGGKGKTSIAYEFARDVAKFGPCGFKNIIWLTAKEQQFYGLTNRFGTLPETHFKDCRSLLEQICCGLGLLEDELADSSIVSLKKMAKQALEIMPSFLIIDDLDSTEPDEQKKIFEAALQIGNPHSRFLLTTRANISYSSDLAIQVPGLEFGDHRDFVNSTFDRIRLPIPPNIDYRSLYEATDGSPLLTESVIRLVKQGYNIDKAIKEWKGQAGEDARSFVLKKEIDRLSPEARTVLFAASVLGQCSFTELSDIVQFEKLKLSTAIEELQSLFLLNSPRIIEKEQRFEVPNTTASLVLEIREQITVNHSTISYRIKQLRNSVRYKNTLSKDSEVSNAIFQANALLRNEQPNEAAKTIDALLKRDKFKNNPDLLLAKGRYQLESDQQNLSEIRKLFEKSYQLGSRKEILYNLWHKAETLAKSPQGIIQVCTRAIDDNVPDRNGWLIKRAQGYSLSASSANLVDSITFYKKSYYDVIAASKSTRGFEKQNMLNACYDIYDRMWNSAKSLTPDKWDNAFDVSFFCLKNGDERALVYNRMLDCIINILDEAEDSRFISESIYKKGLLSAKDKLTIVKQNFSKIDLPRQRRFYDRVSERIASVSNKIVEFSSQNS